MRELPQEDAVRSQYATDKGPPAFEDARSPRQKARAAGLDPNFWYAVEYDSKLKRGQVIEVTFWKRSIALFRTASGELHALDNRCCHRQLKLSLGHVQGDNLICEYHGWCYAGDGRVCHIPHDLFGRAMPSFRVGSYPVKVRYGLIWIFPGASELADQIDVPVIPELEGRRPWARADADFIWQAHHSMIIDNVSDFTHEFLHRRFRPFVGARLTYCHNDGDRVRVGYETQIGDGRFSKYFVDRKRINTRSIELCYEYPYQWSDTGGKIKHWCFLLPIDERSTRVFFVFYFDDVKVPLLPLRVPRWLLRPLMRLMNRLLIIPLLREDGFAVEAEQHAYDEHYDAPQAELNPAVHQFQKLTAEKWQRHLERENGTHSTAKDRPLPGSTVSRMAIELSKEGS
jgi:phenylpropionate dioxygenase-like ring-hydroxylating dioxygenase large terminal subunit